MNRIRAIFLLTLFYLGLTANLEFLNILLGLLVATGVSFLLPMKRRSLAWHNTFALIWAFLRYVWLLIFDLLKSGFQVAGIVLSRSLPIRPGIIALPTRVETEIGAALSAHAITLTPGEMVVEMDDEGLLYTHCLDATRSAAYIQDAQAMREELLDQIFS